MKYRIGIDPGISGALSLLDENLHCIAVEDMPTVLLSNKRKQVNAAELGKILSSWKRTELTVYLEQVSAMPKQGVSSMFSFGTSYGIVIGVVSALQIPLKNILPVKWKRQAELIGKPKDYARTLAQRLYPELNLSRKKDIGRADAILIARYSD